MEAGNLERTADSSTGWRVSFRKLEWLEPPPSNSAAFHFFGVTRLVFLLGSLADLPLPGSSKGLPGSSDCPEVSLGRLYSLHTL